MAMRTALKTALNTLKTASVISCLLLSQTGNARDDATADIARIVAPCQIEYQVAARAACVGLIADQRLLVLESRLANITAGIQGARASTLRGFERSIRQDQRAWDKRTKQDCAGLKNADPVGYQSCRLRAVLARETTVNALIDEVFAPLGGQDTSQTFLPDEAEIEIPVGPPVTPGGEQPEVKFPIPLVPR